VRNEQVLSLNASICDSANFFTIELLPFAIVEDAIKRRDGERRDKIDKGVTDVAFVLKVDWKIKKIIKTTVFLVNSSEEHLLTIFIRDVFNHQSSSRVSSFIHTMKINHIKHPVVRLFVMIIV